MMGGDMLEDEVEKAVGTIKSWCQNGNLYSSTDAQKYFAGFNGGMGNFDLYELPVGWAALIVDSKTSQKFYRVAVIGALSSSNANNNRFDGYFAQISKVTDVKLAV